MDGTARVLGGTTRISVEHVVVASKRPYQQVIDALEARLGPVVKWDEMHDVTQWQEFDKARISLVKALTQDGQPAARYNHSNT